MNSLSSSIRSITVFSDRAQISRTTKIKLEAGTHQIEFADLPSRIDEKSIQLAGKGPALIKNVSFATRNLKTESSQRLEKLLGMKEQMEDQLAEIRDQANRLKSQKAFVDAITGRITAPIENASPNELSPESWQGMLTFQMEQGERIDREIREVSVKERKIRKEIDFINREIKKAQKGSNKTVRVVGADLVVNETADLELTLTYLVGGAGWEAIYDLRVDSQEREVELSYQAMVRQSTGEDWSGAKLSLSTAKPHIHGNPPELQPHFLRRYLPPPAPKPMVRSSKKMLRSSVPMAEPDAEFFGAMEDAVAVAGGDMSHEEVTVNTQAASVVFEINGDIHIPGDNEPHQVMILQTKLSGEFTHTTVPSLSPYAFLQTEVTNDSDFPLLSGNANIYMDGHYISQSYLSFIAPGETFDISLGVDEAVKVEHKFVGKFRKTEGFIGTKKEKQSYQYLTTITNRKKGPIKIEVKDKFPVSQDNDIKVELIKPDYQDDTKTLKKDAQNMLTFTRELPAGDKWEIPIEYHVVYPKDIKVVGL